MGGVRHGRDGAPAREHLPDDVQADVDAQPTVIVDAENVRRSVWPNISPRELVALSHKWAEQEGVRILVVFDGDAPAGAEGVVSTGAGSADDWIARHAHEHAPYWLVTSDRELRDRAGADAERVVGGGWFARELTR